MGAPYLRLVAELRQRITSGQWPPGSQIPSSSILQHQYRLGRGTVDHAIATLRREGVLEGQRGARLFVAYPPAVRTLTDPDADWPHGIGDTESGTCRPSPELQERLHITYRARLRWTRTELLDPDGHPALLVTTWQRGARTRRYSSVRCEVRPHTLTVDEAGLLGLATGSPAFLLERTRFDEASEPVQVADLILPADRWHIAL